ncbi:hypothetical protein [Lewinella sp. W8]|uniref:hypothetical protein n=1 Tax=Lewinella sp. W8 TaxID=2528208 RepID=UPI0010674920|nr:hypothetical protein [Lewinella sp. W8]MTB53865.1 hypothetical protein [Lewinella sp. W8]
MRRLLQLSLLTLMTSVFLTGCAVPIYNSVPSKIPQGSSIKVIHVNPNNPIHATLEQSVLQAGYQVISENTIVTDVPGTNIRYEARDTTIYRSERVPVVRELFEEKDSDYLLRYSYTGSPSTIHSFSASLIEPQSGAIVGTVSYECASALCGGKTVVLRQMAQRLFAQ